jgi:predicted RNase H-like HicB family nuclease
VPALNRISTFGATCEEALERTREAIRAYVTVAERRGMPLPELTTTGATKRRGVGASTSHPEPA